VTAGWPDVDDDGSVVGASAEGAAKGHLLYHTSGSRIRFKNPKVSKSR